MKIKKFTEYIKEDDGGGASIAVCTADGANGAAFINQGSTTGMGNVVSAQPSSNIGSTIGGKNVGDIYGGDGKIGSGDKSSGFKTFNPKKKKKEKKKSKILNQLDMKVMSYDDYTKNMYK
jgi:hypothetical protein